MTPVPRPGTTGQEHSRFGNWAATAPDHRDPRLRGRRYAIPFEEVWSAAMELGNGGLRGWRVAHHDEIQGVIRVWARTLIFRFVDDVEIRIGLDEDAQTRVDLSSASRKGRWDLGANSRRIRKFLKRLDRKLKAPPALILAPEDGVRQVPQG